MRMVGQFDDRTKYKFVLKAKVVTQFSLIDN